MGAEKFFVTLWRWIQHTPNNSDHADGQEYYESDKTAILNEFGIC